MLAPAIATADTDADKTAGAKADTTGTAPSSASTTPSGSPETPSSTSAGSTSAEPAAAGEDSKDPPSTTPRESETDTPRVVVGSSGGAHTSTHGSTKPDTDIAPDTKTDPDDEETVEQKPSAAEKPGSDAAHTNKSTDDQPTGTANPPSSSVSATTVTARTDREAQTSVQPKAGDVATSPAAVHVTPEEPSALDAPAPVTASLPTAVLGALGVLPLSPAAPAGTLGLAELLWGAYRRNESDEDATSAPVATATMAKAAAQAVTGPSANYAVSDDWGTGFVGNVTVNAGASALNGWTVEFDSPAQITNIWNAEIASRTGTHYVIRSAAWNGQVGAGQSASFGFQGSGAASSVTNLSVNGASVGQPTPPTASISDASASEGNSGTSNLDFTVTLSKPSTSPVTIGYTTVNGSATAGQDYTAKSGTVTFAAGETSKTVSVAITGDTAVEPNETLTVTLSNPSGATIADGSGTGTITNDDVQAPPPSVSIGDAAVSEGNGGTGNLTFTVTLSKPATSPVTVAYTTANGTATAGQDFTAASGTVTFAAGETSKTVIVAIIGDTAVEPNETLTVTLSNPSGATIADGSGTGTITNDDVQAPPSGATVVFSKTDDWGQGFTANVNVTAGQSTLNGWTVEFDSPAQITNIWNGVIASQTGTHYVVRNEAWNGQIAAGQTISFGFQATPGGASATATNFTVNGAPAGQTPPSVSIADASVSEGNSGSRDLTFTVTLSKPATGAVTVGYTTVNGTATAGQDYTAASGTITFAAGEISKTVVVSVAGDVTAEATETLTVTLSNPSGATIADGSAIGTITNDDGTPALPGVSISDASALEGNPGVGGIAPGFLSTSGNQIIDSTGKPVQLSGVNWFGAQSSNGVPDGLWTRNYKDMIDQMSAQGFNTIRMPYASAMLHTSAAPGGINYYANPDLQGLSRIQVMDKIIDYAGQKGMRVILDHHRSTEGGGTSDNGLWYEGSYTEDQWVADWQSLATRYKNNPTVIGFDLHNEPYNGTWGGGGVNDWARAAERAGNAVLAVNPNLLVFVEGVGTYKDDSYWWGGQLQGVKDRPIVLNVAGKVVYSPHDYPNSVYQQPWFQGDDFGAQLPAKFRSEWGYIYEQNIAPIYLGEFGTRLQDPKDAVWLEAITSYLSGDLDNNGTIDIPAGTEDMSWTFWSWNPNSTDTGGILADDWRTINENKMVYLHPIEYASGTGGTSLATFVVTLAQPSATAVTVNYATSNGTATSGSDYVGATGSITFAPGETSKTVTVVVLGDTAAEGSENFTVLLSNPIGTTIVDGSGRGTIVDDEAM